jgi:hypothetical protein
LPPEPAEEPVSGPLPAFLVPGDPLLTAPTSPAPTSPAPTPTPTPGEPSSPSPPWDPAVLTGIPSDPPVLIDASRALPPRRLVRGAQRLAHLVGHRLLVGITVQDGAGQVISRDQFCGRVTEVADGVVTVDRDGTPVFLPADEAAYEVAAPGTYRLAGTGEEVVDPDFVTTWILFQCPAGSPPPVPPSS